jgi:hypothetical protein
MAQQGSLALPQNVTAGSDFSIPTSGSGPGQLYIVGPGQVIRRNVQLGDAVSFPASSLHNAGHYLVILVGGSSNSSGQLDVAPAEQPEDLSFLAEPSRLPVSLSDGVSGTVYVFDAYHNLITKPLPVTFQLTAATGGGQQKIVTTRYGVAWTRMNSAPKAGSAQFVASVAGTSSKRIIEEVPGDPCTLTVSAQPVPGGNGKPPRLQLQTAPVRDCSGNLY